jgi:hypothetical protein
MPTADAERLHVGMKSSEFPHLIFTWQPMPPGLQRVKGPLLPEPFHFQSRNTVYFAPGRLESDALSLNAMCLPYLKRRLFRALTSNFDEGTQGFVH